MGGCCNSQYDDHGQQLQTGESVPWVSQSILMNFNKTQAFEHTMPFHTLRIDIFEGNVKRFLQGRTYVTLKQLRYAFKYRPTWQKHLPFHTPLLAGIQKVQDDEDGMATVLTRLITDDYMLYQGPDDEDDE